jgi:hypothetical protein
MKRGSLARVAAIGVAALALAFWFTRGGHDGDEVDADRGNKDPSLLVDRVWVDSRPEKYTDFIHAMLALESAPIGIFQKASAYQSTTELFEFKRRDAVLSLHFPQDGRKRQTKFRIRECSDLPPFDLCLELASNPWGGPRRYYGVLEQDREDALLGELRHQLEHQAAAAVESARSD